MDRKQLYIKPLITEIVIDKSISLAMVSENTGIDPDDPGMWGAPPPNPSVEGGNDSSSTQFQKPIMPVSTFEDNPFK